MADLSGLRVAIFESRRASEMADLVRARGGEPLEAPATRVVPLQPGPGAMELAARLREGEPSAMLFLTDTGARLVPELMAAVMPRRELVDALSGLRLGARGPKTAAALRELGLPEPLVSEPPHTWQSLVATFDRAFPVAGHTVAVQESGRVHAQLRDTLQGLGAEVLELAVYRWDLPEDRGPLTEALDALVGGRARVALFTNGAQIDHLIALAAERGADTSLREALTRAVVGAIGPLCSERLRAFGIRADVVPEATRMDHLVEETARRAREILENR